MIRKVSWSAHVQGGLLGGGGGWGALAAHRRPRCSAQQQAYLSYHLYDVSDFQLKFIIILRQVAERHLTPASPSLAWMGKAKIFRYSSSPKIRFYKRGFLGMQANEADWSQRCSLGHG